MSTVSSSIVPSSTAWYDTSDVKLNDDFMAYRAEVRESILGVLTPLNMTIAVLILTVLIMRMRAGLSAPAIAVDPHKPITFRTFTPRTLLKFNGTTSPMNPQGSVYLAVRGKVHDVSAGRNFYGPGGPYENFAGRDATRGLACQSFDEDMLTKNLDGPLDRCDDLKPEELENLRGWIERFDEKYLVVGRLVAYNANASEF